MPQPNDEETTTNRRAVLAEKGRRLYSKFCGTGGRGICAESFACYHLDRGESVAATDLLAFLAERIRALEIDDPDGRLPITRALHARIAEHLRRAVEGDDPLPRPKVVGGLDAQPILTLDDTSSIS